MKLTWKSMAACILSGCMLAGCAADTAGTVSAGDSAGTGTSSESRQVTEDDLGTAAVGKSDTDGKEETVYVFTTASGTEQKKIVSDWLKNGAGSDTIIDRTELTDVQNVKGDETYTQGTDGTITWAAAGNDIYYQGNTDKAAPVGIRITYQLNGKTVKPEDLAGKSGKITIRFDYTNNEVEEVEENGSKLTVKVPFGMVTGIVLPEDRFSGITATNGKVVSDGSNSIVIGTAFPGLKDSLNWQNLINRTSDAEARQKLEDFNIPEYFEVTANVTDFKLASTLTVASSDLFSEIDLADSIDANEVTGKINDLQDATEQLISGANDLKTGTVQLRTATGDLVTGTNQLVSGASKLKSGAQQVADGAGQVNSGASQLAAGLGTLSANSSALNAGAAQIADGVMKTANDTLIDKDLISEDDPMTWSNYSAKLAELAGITDAMRNSAMAEVKAKLTASGLSASQADQYASTLIYMAAAEAAKTGASISTEADLEAALKTQGANLLNAQSVQGKAAAAAAAAKQGCADQTVAAMLAGVRAGSAGTVYQSTVSQVEDTLDKMGLDKSLAPVVIAYACENGQSSITDQATLAAQIKSAAGELQKAAAAQAVADPLANDQVKALLAVARGTAADQTLYDSMVSQLKAGGVKDDSDAAAIIAYAAYSNGDLSAAAKAVGSGSPDPAIYAQAQNAVNNGVLNDANVKALLAGARAALSDEAVYATLISQIRGAAGTTEAGAALAIVYAAQNYVSDASSLMANLTLAGQALAKASAAQAQAGSGIGDPAVKAVMDQIASTLTDQEVYDTLIAGLEANGASAENAAILVAYAAENYSSLDGSTISEKFTAAMGEIQKAETVAAEMKDAATAEGTALVNGILNALVSNSADYQELTTLQTSLNGIASFVAGLKTYTNGVDSAYSGAQKLAAGTSTLKTGADELNSGTATLQEGITTLNDGAGKLNSGAVQLDEGTGKLQSGLDQFNQEGIQKLTSLFGDNVNDVLDRIHAIETAGENYNNFAGTASDSNTVKFIYKSDAIGE